MKDTKIEKTYRTKILTVGDKIPRYISIPLYTWDMKLSATAKLAYGLLLSRASLSIKNRWIDENGWVYMEYTTESLARDLRRSERTASKALTELRKKDLIICEQTGYNRPTHIYVKIVLEPET